MNLSKLKTHKKTGKEIIFNQNGELEIDLNSFWSWSNSELLGNALRGVLAEYIVSIDIGCKADIREEWDSYDLLSPEEIKVEVKSAAYLQSWEQDKYSAISFGIQPTRGWDAITKSYVNETKRQADVYVFCLLNHKDKATVNPMNLEQWTFYVLTASVLNKKIPRQKKIVLSSLLKLNPIEVKFGGIHEAIKYWPVMNRLLLFFVAQNINLFGAIKCIKTSLEGTRSIWKRQ